MKRLFVILFLITSVLLFAEDAEVKNFELFPWEFTKGQLLEFCSDSWSMEITNKNIFTITPIKKYVFNKTYSINKITITFDEKKDLIINQKLFFTKSYASLNFVSLLELMTRDSASIFNNSSTMDNEISAVVLRYNTFINGLHLAEYYLYYYSENETQIAVNYLCPVELTNP